MKTNLILIDGKKGKEIEVPDFFRDRVREDVIGKILLIERKGQPYGVFWRAGKQNSASGIMSHMRHKWKTQYGHGISRVPRKIMWRRGDQFYWIGAEVAGVRGGRRAHPHKIDLAGKKINKKEYLLALKSALAATASEESIKKKYSSLENKKIDLALPLVVESKIINLKAKEFFSSLKNILGELYEIAIPKKSIRAGKSDKRNRKYKKNAGMILIIGKDESAKISGIDVKKTNELNVIDVASGNPGRLAIFTENAIQDLEGLNRK